MLLCRISRGRPEASLVEPNGIRLEKDLPEFRKPGRVCEGMKDVEVEVEIEIKIEMFNDIARFQLFQYSMSGGNT